MGRPRPRGRWGVPVHARRWHYFLSLPNRDLPVFSLCAVLGIQPWCYRHLGAVGFRQLGPLEDAVHGGFPVQGCLACIGAFQRLTRPRRRR